MSRRISFSSRANCFDSSQWVETNMLTKIYLDKAAFSWEAYEAIVAKLLPGPTCHTQKRFLKRRRKKIDNKRQKQYTGRGKNVCSDKEHYPMGQATRTTKLLLDLGERRQGAIASS
jgi:hypothetical protein